ncbi:hypothetical protein H072_2400 [Dactylellina haptotyla CBS 200.50]|uniref:Arrestin-like N-terminal domain-containing protein n=1 Tax=Dactylellina haptotyla (strain CBS 200.50) TaxID=1284197 RepID=S8BW14_DACHA|nr:hypothetical protein H072_2400 [Dactylellina haptotyla CBS 200.50]
MAPLEIVLDTKGPLPGLPGSRNNLYVAGDTVSGHVVVNTTPEATKNLTIDFTGALTVIIRKGSTFEQKNNLFSFTLNPPVNRECKYPFCFQLPGTVVVAPDENMAPRHVPIAPQQLLPSFSFGYSKDEHSPDVNAKVEYQIIAKLQHKGTIFTKRDSETKLINISSAPIEGISLLSSSASNHIFDLQSQKLRPGMEHYKPTAMERLSSFIGNVAQSFQDPRILVDLQIDLPNSLALGSRIPVAFSINLLPDSYGVDTPPRIYLLKVEAKLQIITEVAVQTATKQKTSAMNLCSRGWDSRTKQLEYGNQHKMDVTDWVSESFVHDVGNQLVPTFTTANLKRKYRLDVEVWLECVGEQWKKTFERELVLLPAFVGSFTPAPTPTSTAMSPISMPMPSEKAGLPLNAVQTDAAYTDAPPSYTEL